MTPSWTASGPSKLLTSLKAPQLNLHRLERRNPNRYFTTPRRASRSTPQPLQIHSHHFEWSCSNRVIAAVSAK